MEILLHIGMRKTGTKSIQSALKGYDDGVWLSPDLGMPYQQQALYTLFAERPHEHQMHARAGRSAAAVEAMRQPLLAPFETALNSGRNLIFSAEAFSRPTPVSNFEHGVVDALRAKSRNIRAIAYVRPLPDFICSWFQQHMKLNPRPISFADAAPHYRASLEKWQRLLGRERVELVPYHPSYLATDSVVSDFQRRVGLRDLPDQKIHQSMSLEATALLYVHRRFGRPFTGYDGLINALHRGNAILSSIGATRFRLSPSYVRQMVEGHQDDIDWCSRQVSDDPLEVRLHLSRACHDQADEGVSVEDDLIPIAIKQIPELRRRVETFSPDTSDAIAEIVACIDEIYRRALVN